MAPSIRLEQVQGVAVLKMDRNVTNPLDLEFVRCLSDMLERVENDVDIQSLVVASANDKFFSIGLDIPGLYELEPVDFMTFYRAFNRFCIDLFTLPKPTVAAITGHAIAGGCIITLCCDYRYISDGHKLMGLNEIKLGVPLPYPADRILHALVDSRTAREILDSGEFYEPEDAHRMGLVDRVVPLDEVLPAAIRKAGELGSLPPAAFASIKRNRIETIEAEILEHLEEKEEVFLQLWYSDEARERLREAIEKF